MEKVQLNNREVLDAAAALRELAQVTLPAAASLRVVRLARAVQAAADDILQVRAQLVERFTERDAAGVPVPALGADGAPLADHVRLTDAAALGREVTELMRGTTELAVQPLRTSELGSGFSVAPRVLLMLGPVLVEDAG